MTDRDKIIKWLERYKSIDRKIQLKCDEKSMWRARATKITPTLSDMPKGNGGAPTSFTSAADKMMEIEEEINQDIDTLIEVRTQIMAAINAVPDEVCKELLERAYIRGQPFEKIAVEMNYCYRWIMELHRKALNLVNTAHNFTS